MSRYDGREYDSDSNNDSTDMTVLTRRKGHDTDSSDDDEDEDDHELQSEIFMEYNIIVGEEQIIQEIEPVTICNPRVARAMSKLQASFNPEAERVLASQQSLQPALKESSVEKNTKTGRGD